MQKGDSSTQEMVVVAFRILMERPTAGGEKFSALIGPSPAIRRGTQALLALGLLAAATGVLRSQAGADGSLPLAVALGLGALSVVTGWLSGGAESLVCQGDFIRHRRNGVLGEKRHEMRTPELRRIHAPDRGIVAFFRGIRIDSHHGSWCLGRRLSPRDAQDLVWLLNRHLALLPEEALESIPADRVSPARSRPVDSPARTSPAEVTRARSRSR